MVESIIRPKSLRRPKERHLGMSLHTLLYEFDIHRAIYCITGFNMEATNPEHVKEEFTSRLLRRNLSTRLIAACLGTASARAGICMLPDVNLAHYPLRHRKAMVLPHLNCGRFRLVTEMGLIRKGKGQDEDKDINIQISKNLPLSVMNAFNLFEGRYEKFVES